MIITADNFKDTFPGISDKEYVGHKKRIYSLNWNCTGTKLGSGSADNTIRVSAGRTRFLALEFGQCYT